MNADLLESLILNDAVVPSARGRRPGQGSQPITMAYVRDLNASDLEVILNPPNKGITTKPLARLRQTHHMLARLIAEGRAQSESALITGYSPSRISILTRDPAFMELVAYYKANVEAQYLNVHERLAALGLSTLDELQERLEQSPESFSARELMELTELCLDRSVTSQNRPLANGGGSGVTLNVNFVQPTPAPAKIVDITPDIEVPE